MNPATPLSAFRDVECHVSQEKPLETLNGFAEVATPIIDEIVPLVEHYRRGLIITRPVIAIAGCSGVGKSYFANLLLENLQEKRISAKIVHFDHFLDLNPPKDALKDIHPQFDYLRAHQFIKSVWDGELIVEKPAWNLGDQEGPEPFKITEIFDLRGVELLIFEGEFTLCDEKTYDFLRFSDVRVAVDADDIDLIRWDWERDRWWNRNISSIEDFIVLRKPSLLKYRELLNPLVEKYANFVVKKSGNHCYQFH